MTDIHTQTPAQGGFAGDPAAALTAAGTGGCCGNPPQGTLTLPDPVEAAASGSPCCGTAAEATEAGACCGTSAKAEAVASGASCCG
ncbi:hypothetical protein Daura_06390 [Dactylosporangium aurantiacum]|uniref:Uncharacterized protein n=1 Tax=Dactylosporangium aurantiacum TaxID=35754 RepID=A0A9Q9MKL5_9ACTN|nr:hypothetical protein [Dactylosporangium aurantiacum]MDG6106139.1 hypothetical protein [Dactylosporangium aurantiacum]UWZ55826.1 hypothetical protein Daura_06390 [Dactylosporangium aurantiacum]